MVLVILYTLAIYAVVFHKNISRENRWKQYVIFTCIVDTVRIVWGKLLIDFGGPCGIPWRRRMMLQLGSICWQAAGRGLWWVDECFGRAWTSNTNICLGSKKLGWERDLFSDQKRRTKYWVWMKYCFASNHFYWSFLDYFCRSQWSCALLEASFSSQMKPWIIQ